MTPVVVRHAVPGDWETLRQVRLTALADAPYAFLTTLAEAEAYPDQLWRDRIEDNPHFLATIEGVAVGQSVVLARGTGSEIVGVWIAPDARGNGVIEALLDAAVSWAQSASEQELHLWVVEGNVRAERAYERYGFGRTGRSQPVPGRPEELEVEMAYSL